VNEGASIIWIFRIHYIYLELEYYFLGITRHRIDDLCFALHPDIYGLSLCISKTR
jgi:hypothetical protein